MGPLTLLPTPWAEHIWCIAFNPKGLLAPVIALVFGAPFLLKIPQKLLQLGGEGYKNPAWKAETPEERKKKDAETVKAKSNRCRRGTAWVAGAITLILLGLAFAVYFHIDTLTDGKMDCSDVAGKFDSKAATWMLDLLFLLVLIAVGEIVMWLATRKLPVNKDPSS